MMKEHEPLDRFAAAEQLIEERRTKDDFTADPTAIVISVIAYPD